MEGLNVVVRVGTGDSDGVAVSVVDGDGEADAVLLAVSSRECVADFVRESGTVLSLIHI